jgi:hypothetical protein
MNKQEKMEDFIENIIRWWEGEDCTYCPLQGSCQYEGREMEEEPPCIKIIAKYFLGKLLTNK